MMSGVRTGFALAAVTFAAFLLSTIAQAQVYRWKDASGNTHYTDSPPPTSAKEYSTVTPPDPNAPRDPRTLPRVSPPTPTIAVQPSPAVQPQPAPAVDDIQKQLEANRVYLRRQQNAKAQKERALRDAEQCTAWYRALERVETAEKQTGPKQPTAAEKKDLAQTKTELKRNIGALCR